MPTINIFAKNRQWASRVQNVFPELAERVAGLLAVPQLAIDGSHVSVRVLIPEFSGMMSPVELEILAHAFPQRVEQQDAICGDIRAWLEDREIPARVWLQLCELGFGYSRKV